MEDLFSTSISVKNQYIMYHIKFDHDKYIFEPVEENSALSSFSLKRENDEWHIQRLLEEDLKKQAVDALETYLLKQH